MINAKKIQNIEEFRPYNEKSRITYQAQGPEGVIGGELEIVTVGPCVARLVLPAEGKAKEQAYLLGCFEGHETIQFAIKAPLAVIVLEPSAEVAYRQQKTFAVADNPNPDENFTRNERMGLEMDELGIALHRQAVLNRIEQSRQRLQDDQYTSALERKLAETSAAVERLVKAQEEAEQARAAVEAAQQQQENA